MSTRRLVESHLGAINRVRALTRRALGPDLREEHLCHRIHGRHLHILWIAGHLANAEDRLINLGLFEAPVLGPDYPRLFANGTQPQERDAYPSLAEILEALDRVHAEATARLSTIDDDFLMRPTAPASPVAKVFPTLEEALRAVAPHEGYHTGQLSILRTVQGLPPLAPA